MRARALRTSSHRTVVSRGMPRLPRTTRSCGVVLRLAFFTSVVTSAVVTGFALPLRFLGAPSFLLDPCVDFLTVDLDLRWRFDAEFHLAGTHLEHGDLDRVADPDVLA